jgi:protein-arginine kinase
MIISTRIRVGRNMDGFPLGPGVSKDQRAEIEKNATTALSTFEGELKGNYYSLASMTDS